MRWSLDLESDSQYVWLADDRPVRQVELPSGVVIDVDESGHAVGIEVVRASAGWSVEEIATRFELDRDDIGSLLWLSSSPLQLVKASEGVAGRISPETGTSDRTIQELIPA
jgi:uncharacterized protein YuzE